MKSRSRLMLEKSISAILSSIEIYNKPDFKYREETFSVLCINAWELLLKSKVLSLSSNKLAALYVMQPRILSNGEKSKILTAKRNRSGNPVSISLFEAYRIITEEYGVKINKAVLDNLTALTEIRDNSIHFFNDDITIALKIQELGSAALQNYLHLVQQWYGDVLSGYNFYLMPLSFFRDFNEASVVSLNSSEKKLLDYIKSVEQKYDEGEDLKDYNLTLRIDIKLNKVKSDSSLPVSISDDKKFTAIKIVDGDFLEKYPWDYEVLTTRLGKRYKDFKVNKKYHDIRKSLESDIRYAYSHLSNPKNPKGARKLFYNPNIQKEFDIHYQK